MRRYFLATLAVVTLALAVPSQPTPALIVNTTNVRTIQVVSLPEKPVLNGPTTYVMVRTAATSDTLALSATLTIPAAMIDITISSIPETPCSILPQRWPTLVEGAHQPVEVSCVFQTSPAAVTVRGTLVAGTRPLIEATALLDLGDGTADQSSDYQFVKGAHALYLPLVARGP